MPLVHQILKRGTFIETPIETQTPQGNQKSWDFVAKENDIIITTYSKTGTTLLQNICHQLRSNADTSFEDIYFVAPWIENSFDYGIDLTKEPPNNQDPDLDIWWRYTPRIFKTHRRLSNASPGGKYITTIRDPISTLVSYYSFKIPELPSDMTLDTFIQTIENKRGACQGAPWDAFKEYWLSRNCEDVLLLCFEDLVSDPLTNIKRIAKFMGIDPTQNQELIEKVCEQSSRQWMRDNLDKFRENRYTQKLQQMAGKNSVAKELVTEGKHHQTLIPSQQSKDFIQQKWKEAFTNDQTTDLTWKSMETYEQLRDSLREFQKSNEKYLVS